MKTKLHLDKLSKDQVKNEKLAIQIEANIVDRLVDILRPEDILLLNQMSESNNPDLEKFLKERCPDFDKVVDEEISKLN